MKTATEKLAWSTSFSNSAAWQAKGYTQGDAVEWAEAIRSLSSHIKTVASDAWPNDAECLDIAEAYKSVGFTFQELKSWVEFVKKHKPDYQGLSGWPQDYARANEGVFGTKNIYTALEKCKKAGLGPEEAEQWMAIRGTTTDASGRARNFNLATAADSKLKGITLLEASAWLASGFSLSNQVGTWKAAGFTPEEALQWGPDTTPSEVVSWKKEGWTLPEANAWMKRVSSLEVATAWRKQGFALDDYIAWSDIDSFQLHSKEAPRIAHDWRGAGFSAKEAGKWMAIGVWKPSVAAEIKRSCPKGYESVDALYQANPYDVKGRCFEFTGETTQILSRTSGLFNMGGQVVLLKFGERSAPPHMVKGIIKGVDTFSYTAVSGGAKIVPALEVVFVSESM